MDMATNYLFCSAPTYMSSLSQSITPLSSTGPGHPRVEYFITRYNGLQVPLIPADELPFSVKLQNVPRVLTPNQTYGLQYCGKASYTGVTFKLEDSSPTVDMQRFISQPPNDSIHALSQSGVRVKQYLAPNTLDRRSPANSSSIPSFTQHKRPYSAAEAAKSWRRIDSIPPATTDGTSDTTQSIIDAILRTGSGAETAERIGYHANNATTPPSGVIPDPDKKEYCTYWILHGDCAYVQQGCRYKHEMPDKAKLAEIGINHVPRWWLERNAAVKLGGERAVIVGRLRKSEEWLAPRKGSVSSESSNETELDEDTAMSEKERPTGMVVKQERDIPQFSTEDRLENGSKSPVIPPSRPPSPADGVRRPSSGSDLISFAPLLPRPSLSALSSTAPPIPSSSADIRKRMPNKPGTAHTEAVAGKSSIKTTRVFVPAGESPEKNIREMTRRDQRERSARNKPPRTTSLTQPARTSKSAGEENQQDARTCLLASRWAATDAKSGERKDTQKHTKTVCRPRRPASSSPPGAKDAGRMEK